MKHIFRKKLTEIKTFVTGRIYVPDKQNYAHQEVDSHSSGIFMQKLISNTFAYLNWLEGRSSACTDDRILDELDIDLFPI